MKTSQDFAIGERVQLHPATDLWMRGACYGTVTAINRLTGKVTVTVDRLNNRPLRFHPDNLLHLEEQVAR